MALHLHFFVEALWGEDSDSEEENLEEEEEGVQMAIAEMQAWEEGEAAIDIVWMKGVSIVWELRVRREVLGFVS